MNPNAKGLSIGAGAGVGTYAGDLILYGLESGLATDFPDNIDTAIIGLAVFVVGWLMYRILPASPAEPKE